MLKEEFNEKFDIQSNHERFGTAPVGNAFWSVIDHDMIKNEKTPYVIKKHKSTIVSSISPDIASYFSDLLLKPYDTTMTFTRFPTYGKPEMASYLNMDILTQALLGKLEFLQITGYKYSDGIILNDEWLVNLQTTFSDNILMDVFLGRTVNFAEQIN